MLMLMLMRGVNKTKTKTKQKGTGGLAWLGLKLVFHVLLELFATPFFVF
jgi:hypothetical protein